MTGKLTPADLERYVFSRTGAPNDDLLVGPGEGEDAAAIRSREGTLVVSADPVSLAAERIGDIGVAVASNDVAASGGVPEFLVSTVLLPELAPDLVDLVTGQLDAAAERLGLTIVGGHTESVAGLDRPLLSMTCLGYADRFVPTGGAEPGDRVLLTKGAGIEATAVLASDFRESVEVDEAVVDRALAYFEELSVMPEAAVLAPVATAMHDPTEGGVLAGLVELARAGGVDVAVDADAVPVRSETRALCEAMGVDPLRVLGSGGLLATVSPDEVDDALAALEREGITAADVGRVDPPEDGDRPAVTLDGERHVEPPRDGMYALWE